MMEEQQARHPAIAHSSDRLTRMLVRGVFIKRGFPDENPLCPTSTDLRVNDDA